MDKETDKIKYYDRKVQYYETDQMGIVHHANYIHWMEEARIAFMEQVGFGYERAVEAGIDFAVTGISCNYKNMVRFGETVRVRVFISSISQMRMKVGYEIIGCEDGKIRAMAETGHCFYDNGRKRPVSLKKVLPELYDLFFSLCISMPQAV